MIDEEVQQKLCTEPKTTVNNKIRFAIAFEEGTIRQQSYHSTTWKNPKKNRTHRNKQQTKMQKDGDPQRNVFVAKEF